MVSNDIFPLVLYICMTSMDIAAPRKSSLMLFAASDIAWLGGVHSEIKCESFTKINQDPIHISSSFPACCCCMLLLLLLSSCLLKLFICHNNNGLVFPKKISCGFNCTPLNAPPYSKVLIRPNWVTMAVNDPLITRYFFGELALGR